MINTNVKRNPNPNTNPNPNQAGLFWLCYIGGGGSAPSDPGSGAMKNYELQFVMVFMETSGAKM